MQAATDPEHPNKRPNFSYAYKNDKFKQKKNLHIEWKSCSLQFQTNAVNNHSAHKCFGDNFSD
jgi:hypothetical protein